MTARSIVLSEMQEVAAAQKRRLAPLRDDLPLTESGLDSLCLAVLVARLEDRLGFDPFTASDDAIFPTTIGDFISLYDGR